MTDDEMEERFRKIDDDMMYLQDCITYCRIIARAANEAAIEWVRQTFEHQDIETEGLGEGIAKIQDGLFFQILSEMEASDPAGAARIAAIHPKAKPWNDLLREDEAN